MCLGMPRSKKRIIEVKSIGLFLMQQYSTLKCSYQLCIFFYHRTYLLTKFSFIIKGSVAQGLGFRELEKEVSGSFFGSTASGN